MAESNNPNTQNQNQNPKPSISESPTKPSIESTKHSNTNGAYSGQRIHYPNPPESVNPDAASLRDQWKFAIKQYSKWYSHAWGTAIFAGGVFFALGWFIKGGNPIPSKEKLLGSSNSDDVVEK